MNIFRYVLIFLFTIGISINALGQTIWSSGNGTLTFTKANNADWTLPENQDRITDNVWITRKSSQTIYNIKTEESANGSSPAGTEWAFGTTDDIEFLTFNTWNTTHSNDPSTTINQDMVLHLIEDDIYLDIKFLSFTGGGGGGGFSYVRAAGPQVWEKNAGTITFTKPSFVNPANQENQDRITDNVWITRGDYGGIYNIKSEAYFHSDSSPEGTEWAVGTTADIGSLSFGQWRNTIRDAFGSVQNIVGHDLVVHLIEDDIYLDIKFLSWAVGDDEGGGGFSYMRSAAPAEAALTKVKYITATSATLFGKAYSKNESADAYFIIGTESDTYTDSVSAVPSSIETDSLTSVSASLIGLTDGVTYYYRLVVSGATHYKRSSEGTFKARDKQILSKSNGTVTFSKANYADWTLPENQDRLTDNVWITRANNEGIFNIQSEEKYDRDAHTSPAGTEWAIGTTADNLDELTFSTWRQITHDGDDFRPPELIGKDVVVHLIEDDIYLDIKFLSWTGGGNGGGFSYARPAKSGEVGVTFTGIFTTISSATITGTVFSKDASATAYVLYGTESGEYTDSVLVSPASIDANTLTNISTNLTGLTEDITYYYRIAAFNGIEYKQTDERNFQTKNFQIWSKNKGTVTFSKANYADWTQPQNQDHLTENVWLTRANERGIFNIHSEVEYDRDVSTAPAGTEWAVGTTADIFSLTFNTWRNTVQNAFGSARNIAGHDMVVHLIEDDIYIDVKFLSWTSDGDGGGFWYARSPKPFESILNNFVYTTTSSATITGNVYSKDAPATAYLLYGTESGEYLDSIQVTPSSIEGDSLTKVSVELTGLTEGSTYYYLLAASNGSEYQRSTERSLVPKNIQIWSKEDGTVTFTKADYVNFKLPENQDRITDAVWLTRKNFEGIFNIQSEEEFDSDDSPEGTEWAAGTTANMGSLVFNSWRSVARSFTGSARDIAGHDMVVHLIEEDIYIDIKFLSWTFGDDGDAGGGGFSYARGTAPLEVFLTKPLDVTATSATLSGKVYSKDVPATAYVVYGTESGEYTDSIQLSPSTINANSLTVVSANLTGLTEGTIYYYRIAASNETLYRRSAERSFVPHVTQIWSKENGTITFSKENYTDWTLPENQDRITDAVWLTRANYKGIFNIQSEGEFERDESPIGTEWAVGTTDNVEELTFGPWRDIVRNAFGSARDITGYDMVVHLIEEDIYMDIKFLSWTVGDDGGGFSYERATAPIDIRQIAVSNITSTSATVTGNVYLRNAAGTAYILYGTTSGVYTDSVQATPNTIEEDSPTEISADISGLSAGTVYYAKISAFNDTHYKRSSEVNFVFMLPSAEPGYALKFDGANDYVEIPDDDLLDITTSYTIEAWIKPNEFSWLGGIVSKYQSPSANGYLLRLTADGTYSGINFDGLETADGILTLGEWYHVAAVKNGGARKVYINGTEVALVGGESHEVLQNSDPVRIGVDYITNGRYFNGIIDEVRIWNVARTEEQITANMNAPFIEPQEGLVAYFQLNENSGTTAFNFGTTSHGKLKNFNFNETSGWLPSTAPLPVELTSFTASAKNSFVEIKWTTATEVNNYGFEVERAVGSTENAVWGKVGFVEGSGTSNAPKEYSFTDKVSKAGKYMYRLKQIDRDGKFEYSQSVEVEISVPKVFALHQNYPNPFNPSTTIGFTLEKSGMTTLKIYDILGKEVTTLVNEELEAGVHHQKQFDARNLASGIYFARLTSGGKQMLKKMLLLR